MKRTIQILEKLLKNIRSIKDFQDRKIQDHIKDKSKDIQQQIDDAMISGIDEHGNLPKEEPVVKQPKKKNHLRLIKKLEKAGLIESALNLQNWGHLDNDAKKMMEEQDDETNDSP